MTERADLEARIARARAALATVAAAEAESAQHVAVLRKLALIKGIGKKRAKKMTQGADFIERTTIAKDVPVTRASALKELEAAEAALAALPGAEAK